MKQQSALSGSLCSTYLRTHANMSGRIVFSDKLEDDGVFPTTLGSLARRSVVLSGAEAVTVNIVESELDPSSVVCNRMLSDC